MRTPRTPAFYWGPGRIGLSFLANGLGLGVCRIAQSARADLTKWSDQRERTIADRAVARIWLAALPPCALQPLAHCAPQPAGCDCHLKRTGFRPIIAVAEWRGELDGVRGNTRNHDLMLVGNVYLNS